MSIGSSIPLYTYLIGDRFLYPFFYNGTCFSLSPFFLYIGSDCFFFHLFADKEFIVPNLNLVNREDLNRILSSDIFLHKDGQLCVSHVILKYTPTSSSFQSPKHVIKAKDPCITRIDIVVPRFLTSRPPKGIQNVELTDQQIAKIIQAEEEVIPSDEKPQDPPRETVIVDFEVFNQPDLAESSEAISKCLVSAQVSTKQEATNIPEAMVLQRRTPNL